MRTFLAKCWVLALIAGGFAFTGDAGRLLDRGRGVIEATTVPSDPTAPAPTSAPPAPASPPQDDPATPGSAGPGVEASDRVVADAETGAEPQPEPFSPTRTVPPADAPVGTPIIAAPPPAGAPTAIDIRRLVPGDRVVVWIGRRDGRSRSAATTIAFDVVDPVGGECLEVRHPSGTDNAALHAPCRRVRIVGSVGMGFFGTAGTATAGTIVTGQSLQLASLATDDANSAATRETIGPVLAMVVAHP